MPRPSRKDRKVQRERAQRASGRGLPAPAPVVYKSLQQSRAQRSLADSEGAEAGQALGAGEPSKSRVSQWIIVLGIATLLLLGISLWKTLSSH